MAPRNLAWSDVEFRACTGKPCSDHCRILRQPETPEEVEQTIQAAVWSCVEAIRYCGTDPAILARFRELGMERLCDAIPPPEKPE
jgi:hypothetical protein